MNDAPLLDPEVVERLLDLARDVAQPGEDVLGDLLHTFETDLRARLDSLADARARGDGAFAAETAHALKGASLTMGGVRLASLLKDTEPGLRDGSADPEVLDSIPAVAQETLEALRTALGPDNASR